MTLDEIIYRNYTPTPFWALDPVVWQDLVSALDGENRAVLASYPFKWAFTHPNDSRGAVEFLEGIGVGGERVRVDAIERLASGLPTFESLISKGSVDWKKPSINDVPVDGFRMIPEWEPMAGTLINWPTFYPPLWETFRQMVDALSHATVYLRIPEGYLGAVILAWLEVEGIELGAVRPVPGPVGDIWARDYSPVYGMNRYSGEPVVHKFAFAAYYPEYREKFQLINDIDDRFAWTEGFQVYRTEIMYDGGYLLTDGNGTYIMTRRVLWDNTSLPNLYARLEAWLGADRLIFINEEPGDALGHINNLKFISPNKMLIGMPEDVSSPVYKYLANLHELFAKYGYEVISLPCPVGPTHLLPGDYYPARGYYANSLLLNQRVLVCQYGRELQKYDEEALQVYRTSLPDYEVIPIDCSILANGGGGINCSTHEIPDVNKITLTP